MPGIVHFIRFIFVTARKRVQIYLGSGTYYEAQLNFGSGELILNKTVGGTTTALATVSRNLALAQ